MSYYVSESGILDDFDAQLEYIVIYNLVLLWDNQKIQPTCKKWPWYHHNLIRKENQREKSS